MESNKKRYFASDFHLGLNSGGSSSEREKRVVAWLERIAPGAEEIYLLGDVFDFWWEYHNVVPKGFTRFLGAVSSITDSGIPVHFFKGNHDMWTTGYLRDECGMTVHEGIVKTEFNNHSFLLAHGEGLGGKQISYNILLSIFRSSTGRKIYSALHPRIGVGIGHHWSLQSRLGKGMHAPFMGEKEHLVQYAREILEKESFDYFIFGHRHLPLNYPLNSKSRIVILGDWMKGECFAEWDGSKLKLICDGQELLDPTLTVIV